MFPLYDENPTHRTPYATVVLIVLNTLVMIWLATLSPDAEQLAFIKHGFVPARIAQLSDPKLVVGIPLEPDRAQPREPFAVGPGPEPNEIKLEAVPTQILGTLWTTMFMHGGWMHLFGNMWFLWIFGNNVEDRLGSILFLIFYLVGGLLASAAHWASDPASTVPVVGASGAVATILGAYAVTYPKAKIRTLIFYGLITIIDVPALLWLVLWLGGQLVIGLFLVGQLDIAVWAHVGGFVAGAVLMPLISLGAPPPGTSWEDELQKHFSPPAPDTKL